MYLKTIAIISLTLGAQLASATETAAPLGKSRAEVIAELQAARAAGELPIGEYGVQTLKTTSSTKTRAEVTAELVAARKAGQLPLSESSTFGFDSGSKGPGKTREAVLKELADYIQSGQMARDRVAQELGGN